MSDEEYRRMIRKAVQRPRQRDGGSTTDNGCAVTAIALVAAPWLLDLLLAGSAVTW